MLLFSLFSFSSPYDDRFYPLTAVIRIPTENCPLLWSFYSVSFKTHIHKLFMTTLFVPLDWAKTMVKA